MKVRKRKEESWGGKMRRKKREARKKERALS